MLIIIICQTCEIVYIGLPVLAKFISLCCILIFDKHMSNEAYYLALGRGLTVDRPVAMTTYECLSTPAQGK
jgi:hypothetical protein